MEHFSLKKFPVFIMGLFLLTFTCSDLRAQEDSWSPEQINKVQQLGSSPSDHRSLELIFIRSEEAFLHSSDVVFHSEEQALISFIGAAAKKDIHTMYVIAEQPSSRYLSIWQAVNRLLAIENK